MGINGIKRKDRIKESLNRKGQVSVSELVSMFKVSEVTVRRYLEELEKEKFLVRTYGGAVRMESSISSEFFFGEKSKKNITEKRTIAKESVAMIKNGETIFFDTGTTTLEICKLLVKSGKTPVVVTTSLPIVSELSQAGHIKVFVLGGFLRRELMDFSGHFLREEIANFTFDQAFLGVDAISAEKGLTTTDTVTAGMEEAAMDKARIINIVADYSKIGRVSLIPYGNIRTMKKAKRIITDSRADRKELEKLKNLGFEIRIAR